MNWKKRYEKIKPGDKVKLIWVEDEDIGVGIDDSWVGRVFTFKKVDDVLNHETDYNIHQEPNILPKGTEVWEIKGQFEERDPLLFYACQMERVT